MDDKSKTKESKSLLESLLEDSTILYNTRDKSLLPTVANHLRTSSTARGFRVKASFLECFEKGRIAHTEVKRLGVLYNADEYFFFFSTRVSDLDKVRNVGIATNILLSPLECHVSNIRSDKTPTEKGSAEERVNAVGASTNVKALYYGGRGGSWEDVRGGEEVVDPVDVVGSVGDGRAELSVGDPPGEGVVVEEEDACELSCGVVVGPVDAGARGGGGEGDEGFEGRVEGGEGGEIGWVV